MNSVLLWLGIIVALILTAAFAAPFFIDWSGQRAFFEARASALMGRPVEFAGPLEVRLVPFPSLTARDVRIGAESSEGGEGADAIVMRAALAPLLSGELEISQLVVVRPRVTMVIDEDGTPRLAARSNGTGLPLPPERTQIDHFEIHDGTVALEDTRTGERHEITELHLTGSAGTLAGPFRAEGGARLDSRSYTLSLATGRLQADSSLRMTASINPADRPLAVELDGVLTFDEVTPQYRGGLVLTRPQIEGSEETPWQLRADVAASPRDAVLENLAVEIGEEGRRVMLSGAANIQLGAAPYFDAVLSARQIDFDNSFGGGPEDPVTPAEALSHLASLLEPAIFPIAGNLAVDVESLVVAGHLVEAVEVDVAVEDGRWEIERATAYAPGQTDVGLSGVVDFTGADPAFDGALRLRAQQAGALASWLFGADASVPGLGAVAGRLEAEASLRMQTGALEIEDFTVASAGAQMTGALSYAAGTDEQRPRLALQMQTDRFVLDSLAGPGGTPIAALGRTPAGINFELRLAADRLVTGSAEIGDVQIDAMLSEDDLRIEQLHIGDLGGGRLDGHGEINDMATAPEGSFEAEFEARSLDGLAASLTALGLEQAADRLGRRAEALAPARLVLNLEAARSDESGSRAQLTFSGETGGTLIDASLGFEGNLDALQEAEFDLAVEAANPQPGRLMRQLGASADIGDGAEGRITIAARGEPAAGMPFTLSATGIGIDGTAEGRVRFAPRGGREISAAFGFAIPRLGAVLQPAGIDLPGGRETRLRVDGQLSAVDEVWRFSQLVIASGEERLQGAVAVDFGGQANAVQGNFQAGHVSLPWLLGAALGPAAVGISGDTGTDAPAWPQTGFSPVDRSSWQGEVAIDARRLDFGRGFVADNASLTVGFDPERLALNGLSGQMFGGTVGGDVDLTTAGGNVRLEAQLDVSEMRVEEFVWRADGRPVASGALSAGVEIGGSGRSMLGLVSTLTGNGAFRIEDGVIRRLNPHAFDRIVSAADAGLALEEDRVREVFAGHLDAGSLTFDRVEGALDVASGVVRSRNVRLGAGRLDSFVSATIDLTVLGIDSEWSLAVQGNEDDSRTREVGIIFAGPLSEPSRMIDVSPLLGYLTVRAFEQDVERLERLQADILERERLGRELLRLGEQRRRREREAAEAAQREAEEAARRQAKQEARREAEEQASREAEEEARRREEEEARRREEASRREEARRREEEAREKLRRVPPPAESGAGGLGLGDDELQRLIEESLRRVPPDAGVGAPPYSAAPSGEAGSPNLAPAPPVPQTTPLDIRPPASRS